MKSTDFLLGATLGAVTMAVGIFLGRWTKS